MKIYVTQGHENGIGLEVFFKSCLMLTETELSYIKLLAYSESAKETLITMKMPFELHDTHVEFGGVILSVEWLTSTKDSESFSALKWGIKLCERGGLLFTLPTSKDQFPGFAGHTEYFRHHYKSPELGMFFSAPNLKVLLLSDHLAINKISKELTEEILYSRLKTALLQLQKWKWPTKKILISGFNPHAGENGLIGHEDSRITNIKNRLSKELQLDMSGPLPGDTMLFEQKSENDILVYVFHDQGLGVFKTKQGFIGSNITLGLPYPRFSPDHGTSFSLYGKNVADYRGCAHALKEALNLLTRISHGKNTSHQS